MKSFSILSTHACLAIACLFTPAAAAPLAGYSDHAALRRRLHALDKSELVSVQSLATTQGGRELLLVTLSRNSAEGKPALLVVGSAHGPHLLGSELCLRMLEKLVERAEDDRYRKLLERFAFYFVPQPNPDASDACFQAPFQERNTNQRAADDDRDGRSDEDGGEDLDGDGFLTQMRVQDETGDYAPHPDDPRVLIAVDRKKGERGRYRLLSEGRDNDGDRELNEDGPGGVAFDRNFTFNYPFFKPGAGPHQVSEPESRGLADFAFSRPNVAAVFCFSPEDNLYQPWKTGNDSGKIRTSITAADAASLAPLAAEYRKLHGGKEPPPSAAGAGSFSDWAYFHYGRWSFAARGWWIPPVAAGEKPADAPASDLQAGSRGAEDLNALRWFAAEKVEGFSPWKPFQHPDFPGQNVEIGGFRPLVRLNPPAGELDDLAERHLAFLYKLCESLPRLRIGESKLEPLGGGLYRATLRVHNDGPLPTLPEIAKITGEGYPLQAEVVLSEGVKLVTGSPRGKLEIIPGHGGFVERTWHLQRLGPPPVVVRARAWSPTTGSVETQWELK